MGASSAIPRGALVVHHGADELLIEQDSVPDKDKELKADFAQLRLIASLCS
jgi:hypothetical protein